MTLYQTALRNLWLAVRTPQGCGACDGRHEAAPTTTCPCPCHEAARVLLQSGVVREVDLSTRRGS